MAWHLVLADLTRHVHMAGLTRHVHMAGLTRHVHMADLTRHVHMRGSLLVLALKMNMKYYINTILVFFLD